MAGRRLGPGGQDAATQTDSPSCCAAVLSQLQAVQRELSEARRQLQGAQGSSLQPASPQAPVPEQDPLELPSYTSLTDSSNLRILGEMIQQTEAPAGLGPCPLLVKSEPVDEEPPSSPLSHPLWLQDLPCKEELTDDSPPHDDAEPDADATAQVPASPTADRAATATDALLPSRERGAEGKAASQQQQSWAEYSEPCKRELDIEDWEPPAEEDFAEDLQPAWPQAPVQERDPLELPSCTSLTASSNLRILGEGWAEYAEPCKGELDTEDWELPAEQDFAQEETASDPVLLTPHILSKLQLGPKKRDSLAGSRAAPTVLVQQLLHGCTNWDRNFVSKYHVCKQILPETQPFTCEDSGAQFANRCNSHEHAQTHTREEQHKWKVCGKYFSRVSSLLHTRRHINTGERERQYLCEECGKAFQDSGTLIKHKSTHITGEKPYKCDICGKAFKRSDCLISHNRTHTGERPFKCNVCGKGFKQSGTLIEHTRTHTGERPFKCNVCGEAYQRSYQLIVHSRSHTDERAFICEVCGKAFKNSPTLLKHTRTHRAEERPFNCNVCGKTFKESHNLIEHTRTHTGERPFKCNTCGKAFKVSGALRRHTRTHTGERPFKCNVCCKTFNESGNLMQHTRVHTGERPFKCEVCGKAFKHSKHLVVHTRAHMPGRDCPNALTDQK